MFQQIILVGNLGRDPEMRFTGSGQAVTNLNVATNKTFKDKAGNVQKQTTWFRVSVWGNQAQACNQYLAKGRQVMVVGTLRVDPETGGPRIWTGNDGKARASLEVNAYQVKFLGAKPDGTDAIIEGDEEQGAVAPDMGSDELPF